jgi:hypothetical protein
LPTRPSIRSATRQHDLFGRNLDAVNGGRVNEDGAETTYTHAHSDCTGAFFRTRLTIGEAVRASAP